MKFDHIKLFVQLAKTQNISQAGKELGLSPAVASSHLIKLEQGLNARLVHRTTRKVALTEEGQAFLPYAEELLNGVAAARAAVGAGSISPQGTLRITAPASFGRMHLMPFMGEFLKQNPDVTVDLRLSDSIVDMVEGGFDIAIRNAELKDSTLVARKLAEDRRIVCASPTYIEKHGEPDSPEELTNHTCIHLLGLENWIFDSPRGRIIVKTSGRIRTDNGEAVRDACASGLGITVNSTWSAYEHLRRGELVEVLKDFPLISGTAIWAVYPNSRLLAPKVRAFIDYFSTRFGDTPYWDAALDR